ncbi:hypothetical protein HDU78_005065 [Chytriomyces hyalinus]|nr:hypothetical protein HDU78_005065 [Chytriomyces hyalinus]
MHRDELVAAVTKHFNEQQLNEKDAVSHFIYALRNQGVLWKANLANRIGADNAVDEEENRD